MVRGSSFFRGVAFERLLTYILFAILDFIIIVWSSGRRPWFPKFRSALAATDSLEALERLLRFKVERWRGRTPRTMGSMENNDEETSLERGGRKEDEFGFAF